MKLNTLKTLGLVAVGYILFSSFKNKTKTGSVKAFDYQGGVPSGTQQVFSKVGTIIYDQNMQPQYTYNTAGIGMTITGNAGTEMYSVVYGANFESGISGLVYKTDVQVP
jgi:hypothetical protein